MTGTVMTWHLRGEEFKIYWRFFSCEDEVPCRGRNRMEE